MTRIKTAWQTARDGTKRTLGWAAGGVRSLFTRSSGEDAPPSDRAVAKPAPAAKAEETTSAPGRGRKIAIFAAAGLVVAIWIGWTAYVWNENGSTAGIGVLISWPAVFAALALVSAPFVGAMVVRRQRTAGEADLAAPETATVEPEAAESQTTSPGDADEGEDAEESDETEEAEEDEDAEADEEAEDDAVEDDDAEGGDDAEDGAAA